jgi:hypothetical protein
LRWLVMAQEVFQVLLFLLPLCTPYPLLLLCLSPVEARQLELGTQLGCCALLLLLLFVPT